MTEIIVTTSNEVPGKEVAQILGVVRGNTVRARNLARDIGAGLMNLLGGVIRTDTAVVISSELTRRGGFARK